MSDETEQGHVIVISGPGGVGKGTVVDELLTRDDRLRISRSWTTRDQRPGEADDAYHFVSHKEFETAIETGAFLEYDHHFGNYYGSPVPDIGDVFDLILEIDVNGANRFTRTAIAHSSSSSIPHRSTCSESGCSGEAMSRTRSRNDSLAEHENENSQASSHIAT